MNRQAITLLLLLNLAGLAVGLLLFSRHLESQQASAVSRAPVTTGLGRKSKPIKTLKIVPTTGVTETQPRVIYKTNEFRWSQVESADYREYIANLRAIGCPELTIKDIILTDVMKLYATRRGHLYHNGRDFKFWETDEKRKLKQSQLEEREHELSLIDKELPTVLRELLGINYERELNKYFVDTNEDDHRLSFLPEGKRSQLLALRDQIEGQRERVFENMQDGRLSPGAVEKLKEIEKYRQQTLARLLSPEELEQYELCTSETADRLRQDLIGFNPTESEFRELFHRRQALEAKYQFQDLSDETLRAAKAADEAAMETELKDLLGESRATEYTRVKSSDYRDVALLSERFELPPSTCQTLMDIRGLAEAEKQKLVLDRSLAEDVRFRALKAVRTETEKHVQQLLGNKAYTEYSQTSGRWIEGLGPH